MTGFWDKAVQAADDARYLLAASRHDAAVNRAYYAMFHAARACLAAKTDLDMIRIKRHSTVLQLFFAAYGQAGTCGPDACRGLEGGVRGSRGRRLWRRAHPAEEAGVLVALMDELMGAAAALIETGETP